MRAAARKTTGSLSGNSASNDPFTCRQGDRTSRSSACPRVVFAFVLMLLSISGSASSAELIPSPLQGPGVPELSRSERRAIDKAWAKLDSGRLDAAAKRAARSGASPAAELLRIQIDSLSERENLLADLQRLADENPEYAAAWATLSLLAEAVADEPTAYSATRHVAELWAAPRWSSRAEELEKLWVEDRVALADRLVAAQAPQDALHELEAALMLEPDHRDGLLVEARALLAMDRIDDANGVLARLGNDPEALMMAGEIAELERDWLTAMDRYDALPADTPGRDAALRRAKLNWRLSVLPAHTQRALASLELSRSELAVLLVALVPQIEAIGGGQVPLLSDIVDLRSQREIVTVVRLELMTVDRLEHRFDPHRAVTADEVRTAVDRLAALLGAPAAEWCTPSHVLSSCQEIVTPVTGRNVADVIVGLIHEELE
jgi:hypothetical protein